MTTQFGRLVIMARKIADAVLEAKASIVETKPAAKKAKSAAKKSAVEASY